MMDEERDIYGPDGRIDEKKLKKQRMETHPDEFAPFDRHPILCSLWLAILVLYGVGLGCSMLGIGK